jgi:signal peptidase I
VEESLAHKNDESMKNRRSEKEGLFNFSREMISALLMAFIAIVYVIQAFRIPTGSMERSLLVGDFLLGLKFMYGSPVLPIPNTYLKFPGITDPKPGDVIIFKYPGFDRKDYIKRCIAGPGQTIEIHGMHVIVDGRELILPPKGQYLVNGNLPDARITEFPALRIPAKGDTLDPQKMGVREFLFFKHLVEQENPRAKVAVQYQLYLNGVFANDRQFNLSGYNLTMQDLHEDKLPLVNLYNSKKKLYFNLNHLDDWTELDRFLSTILSSFPADSARFRYALYLNGVAVQRYIVKKDNYFMMGDNRDNSKDSRFWGYLNRNFIKAKAFILYFSVDLANKRSDGTPKRNYYDNSPEMLPFYYFPLHIRWNRIGKLIRSFYETVPVPTAAATTPTTPTTAMGAPDSSAAALRDSGKAKVGTPR